jgi:hypothetical protein
VSDRADQVMSQGHSQGSDGTRIMPLGHAQIQTTLVYMQITPLEVYQQYARAVAQLIRPVPVTPT